MKTTHTTTIYNTYENALNLCCRIRRDAGLHDSPEADAAYIALEKIGGAVDAIEVYRAPAADFAENVKKWYDVIKQKAALIGA